MDTQESTFSLPNVSVGPDPFSPETLDDDVALEIAYTYRSSSTFDRPDLEGVRSELDELRAEPSA